MQRYTVYFIWKLLHKFRVVLSPIIRSANNCIYSTWYLSHRYCYLSLYLEYDEYRTDSCGCQKFADEFQASSALSMRSALFWNFTQHKMVVYFRRFGTTFRSLLQRSNNLI